MALAETHAVPLDSSLDDIRQRAVARLEELQPLLEEAERLRRVISALEGGARIDEHGRAQTPSGRAPQGANKRRILAAVADHPGITPAQVARLIGMKRTVVAATMNRLKRSGELESHGEGARVPKDRLAHVRSLVVVD